MLLKMKVIEAKIVVLGSQGVGKTSLVVRYIGKMFSKHISPTIGASFFTCNINLEEARIKLQVWDTAGQERFRSMAPMYYRNANAALLVFDITSVASFVAIKSWVKELQSNVPEPLVLALVGNKADLGEARAVSASEAARFATSLGAPYRETSALHDQGIEQVFVETARSLLAAAEAPSAAARALRPAVEEAKGAGGVELPACKAPPLRHGDAQRPLCC